ncbi:MAG: cell division FtsZ family protein [Thermoplasmata archaeon]|nr:cell division FtsZ family protein [Thermoplasmata archaeon]
MSDIWMKVILMGWDMLLNEAMEFNSRFSSSETKILVAGVGGAGCNTVNTLSALNLKGVDLLAINTDRISLERSGANKKLLLGKRFVNGQSTSGNIELGEQIAESSIQEINQMLEGYDIIFVLAGLGGGSGGGIGPVVAQQAKRNKKSLVVSIVTLPFKAEGKRKMDIAKLSLEKFYQNSNTVIVLENDRLLNIVPNLPLEKAFKIMDYLVSDIIHNISEAINKPSMIHIDFADLMKIMKNGGTSTVMYGEGEINSIPELVSDTLKNKFYNVDHTTAEGALINIVTGPHMSLSMMNELVERLTEGMDEDSEKKVGIRIEEDLSTKVRVTAIFTNVKYLGMTREVSLVKEEAFSDIDSVFP